MKYQSSGAFRQALEADLRKRSLDLRVPLVRLRKMVTFERFLVRLAADGRRSWLLKGGMALQWRLGNHARTTKDLDLLLTVPLQDMHQALVRAALLDIGDWFRFLVQQSSATGGLNIGAGLRFHVQSLLDGRPFEEFHIDVGWGDPIIEMPEEFTTPSLLSFAGVGPVTVLCYPVSQHIAEKVHAYTRPHISGASSRVKDLIDIVLIARAEAVDGAVLCKAIGATFAARATHAQPPSLPDAPAGWTTPFAKMAREVGLQEMSLAAAVEMARRFLNPALQAEAQGRWDPATGRWL